MNIWSLRLIAARQLNRIADSLLDLPLYLEVVVGPKGHKAKQMIFKNFFSEHRKETWSRTFLLDVEKNDEDASKPFACHFNLPNHFAQNLTICCLSYTKEIQKSVNVKTGVLNDQIFKKALFRFRTTNWYLLSVFWLIIYFSGKKIAAPQSQQDKVQRIPFASQQIHLRLLSQPGIFFVIAFYQQCRINLLCQPASRERRKEILSKFNKI